MPELPKDPMYSEADPEMEFRVVKQGLRPGRVKLQTLAVPRLSSEAVLSSRIDQEATARQTADTTEVAARTYADMQEGQARAAADTALQTQITALKASIVPLTGTLSLPAGLTLLQGKTTRSVAVTGVKVGDNLVVTPNAALPANLSMSECYCTTAGTLSVVLINSATLGLSIATAQTIPLGIIALRP